MEYSSPTSRDEPARPRFGAKSKMAGNKKKLLLVFTVSLQISLVSPMFFQQYTLLLLWKINEENMNRQLASQLLRKRSNFIPKLKISRQRRLARRKRQFWHTPAGRTGQWWENILGRKMLEEQWVKIFE